MIFFCFILVPAVVTSDDIYDDILTGTEQNNGASEIVQGIHRVLGVQKYFDYEQACCYLCK